MNKDLYIKKLKSVENQSHLENGYSHVIYQLFDIVLEDKYSIVDVTELNRKEGRFVAPKDLVAVTDFVITTSDFKFDDNDKNKILGCVEVKVRDDDVLRAERLESNNGEIGYLENFNNKVIYTNGWIWKFSIDGKSKEINLRKKDTNAEYGRLLSMLCSIKWTKKRKKELKG